MSTLSPGVPRPRRPRLQALIAITLVTAFLATGCSSIPFAPKHEYTVNAVFDRAISLYPGSPVRVLGIEVGSVTAVEPEGENVAVTMHIGDDTELPKDAFAVIVPVTALGERYVQLGPVHESGPTLGNGDTIPLERTRVPFEIDELLSSLEAYLGNIDSENATDLIENLASLVDGQGEEINELIGNASGTFSILADRSEEIGVIIDSLAELSTTLGGHTDTIESLIRSYDTVSGVLADNDPALNAFITNLNRAAVEVGNLLQQHEAPLQTDIGELTHIGRTVQRNISRLEQALSNTPRLFAAAASAYNEERTAINLNNTADEATSEDLYKARIRDRLAGICRRLIVLLGGPGDPASQGLVDSGCADTESSFWDSFVSSEAPAEPPASESQGSQEPPAPPEPPDLEQLLTDGLNSLLALIDPSQLSALEGLTPELLAAIQELSPQQLSALLFLTPEQLAALRTVPPEELPGLIDRMIAGTFDPADLLDQPLLPPSPPSSSGGAPGGGVGGGIVRGGGGGSGLPIPGVGG